MWLRLYSKSMPGRKEIINRLEFGIDLAMLLQPLAERIQAVLLWKNDL